jgi:hypothetical protein
MRKSEPNFYAVLFFGFLGMAGMIIYALLPLLARPFRRHKNNKKLASAPKL